MSDVDYLNACTPLSADELEDLAIDTQIRVSSALMGLDLKLQIFEHHNGDEASLALARKQAADVHSYVCARLREFGRRS